MGLFSSFRKRPAAPAADAALGAAADDRSHFLRDYEALVDRLEHEHPYDEAMSIAIGSNYGVFGSVEREVVTYAGLANGKSILDFGCGSGRLAHTLPEAFSDIDYTGIDVVQRLLDYAKTKCPADYKFLQSHAPTIPMPDESADVIACFSVFTHLHHAETYLYLREMRRILRPGGRIAMSFLEFEDPSHWPMFMTNVDEVGGEGAPLNAFLSRSIIEIWCTKIGLEAGEFADSSDARWNGHALGQSLAFLARGMK